MIDVEKSRSGLDSLGISWEETTVSDIFEIAVQEDNSFETDTAASVWVGTESERFDIVTDGTDIQSTLLGSLGE